MVHIVFQDLLMINYILQFLVISKNRLIYYFLILFSYRLRMKIILDVLKLNYCSSGFNFL